MDLIQKAIYEALRTKGILDLKSESEIDLFLRLFPVLPEEKLKIGQIIKTVSEQLTSSDDIQYSLREVSKVESESMAALHRKASCEPIDPKVEKQLQADRDEMLQKKRKKLKRDSNSQDFA